MTRKPTQDELAEMAGKVRERRARELAARWRSKGIEGILILRRAAEIIQQEMKEMGYT